MITQADIDAAVAAHALWAQNYGREGKRLEYVDDVFENVSFSGTSIESSVFSPLRKTGHSTSCN